MAEHAGVSADFIRQRAEQLHESNPMLGHRGCRLCITYPEILEMQVRAIIEAAINCTRRGVEVLPEIMIPLSIDAKELRILTDRTRALADAILDEAQMSLQYMVGTMIETPRAALLGDRIAEVAEFFSFGTNDLTQTTLGLSRDDAEASFLSHYLNEGILADNPFETIDQAGVGALVKSAVLAGRKTREPLKLDSLVKRLDTPALHKRLGLRAQQAALELLALLLMTDREDLDDQIWRTFMGCGVTDQKTPHAHSGKDLQGLLHGNHRYIFSLIHKFNQPVTEPYSGRDDIIVISDEAHRTQAGKFARNMRLALPNAAFIGFTGTPLFKHDELTKRIFGNYISRYDFKRSEEDQATVKLVNENRGEKLGIARLDLNDRIADAIEKAELDPDQVALLEKLLGKDYEVITADDRLDRKSV